MGKEEVSEKLGNQNLDTLKPACPGRETRGQSLSFQACTIEGMRSVSHGYREDANNAMFLGTKHGA